MTTALIFGGDAEAMLRYVGGQSPGAYIDQGLMIIFYGLIVGVLTEISRSVAKFSKNSHAKIEGNE
ncbi:hypothetical protein [Shimia marina]|uniref:hypothetical protein n=1 Tax=Shimia marina TaxID=321267 RepID=UPI001187490E|nr:hypothetical protein [Shimia marina]